MTNEQIRAFAAYCVNNKLDLSKAEENKKAWEASLKSDDPNKPAGKRGRQKGAKTRAFFYAGDGSLLSHVDCADKEADRMGASVTAMVTHGMDKVARTLYTRGFVGENPKTIQIVLPDGTLVEGYAVSRIADSATGEESIVDSDDSDSDDSAEAHAAE